MAKIGYTRKPDGQNRVPPSTLVPGAPSNWPTLAQTRLWPSLKRVHPILATHPPIGYPISITPTRLWPGYSTSSPHAHASSRHRGTRRVIFAVDVVVPWGRTLTLLCSLLCDAPIINTSYQKLPFGSGHYPDNR